MHKRSHFYKTLKSESLKYKIEKTNNAARKKSLTQTRQKKGPDFQFKTRAWTEAAKSLTLTPSLTLLTSLTSSLLPILLQLASQSGSRNSAAGMSKRHFLGSNTGSWSRRPSSRTAAPSRHFQPQRPSILPNGGSSAGQLSLTFGSGSGCFLSLKRSV